MVSFAGHADPGAAPPTILPVDADVLVRHRLADYLRGCGFRVIEAGSTDEALVVLDEDEVRVDAVLCDAGTAGSVNGFELRRWIRDHRRDLAGNVAAVPAAAAELCDEGPRLKRPYDPKHVVDYVKRLRARRESARPR